MVQSPPRVGVVLVAAGAGTRLGAGTNKVLLPLHGLPILVWSLRTVCSLPYVEQVCVVVRPEDHELVATWLVEELAPGQEAVLVHGGATRHESEARGIQALSHHVDADTLEVLVVHDAARPLAPPALFDATVRAAQRHGGAVPVRALPGLVGAVESHPIRDVVGVQTPQAFRATALVSAYARAVEAGFAGTDTASTVAAFPEGDADGRADRVMGVSAPAANLKVTFPGDLDLLARLAPHGPPSRVEGQSRPG